MFEVKFEKQLCHVNLMQICVLSRINATVMSPEDAYPDIMILHLLWVCGTAMVLTWKHQGYFFRTTRLHL
jgi:hypothetical protein